MKYTSLVVALIGASQAVKINDVKLPEYRSEFYGDTWRYTGHHRLASEEDWVADAPAAYTVVQINDDESGYGPSYDTHHDKLEDKIVGKYRKTESNRQDGVDRAQGAYENGNNVYPHPPELKSFVGLQCDGDDDDHSCEVFTPEMDGQGDNSYERVVTARFDGDSDDIFMRSMIKSYANEKKNKDGSPSGKFIMTEAAAMAASSEVLETHKGLTG